MEKDRITLILLDVLGVDKKGHPLPELGKDDFQLLLNGRRWPIYSVDDLCSVPSEPAAFDSGEWTGPESRERGQEHSWPASASDDPVSTTPPTPEGRPRFVFYLDFGQLQLEGRARALNEARRWVREEMQPGDEVMIMAHSLLAGLTRLSSFSQDREHLLAVIDDAETAPELFDQFAAEFPSRVEECQRCVTGRECMPLPDCCMVCRANAMQDYYKGRASLRTLRQFLASLEEVPGRKELLLFNQNGVLSPGVLYFQSNPDLTIGHHYYLLQEVAAEATAAHASVNPIQVGEHYMGSKLAREAVTLGANLADFTGGRYNRGPSDLADFVGDIGRGRSCIYRIGFEPPDTTRTRVYTAKVSMGGHRAQFSYRVRFLTDEDRLMRRAQSVLSAPHNSSDLALAAGLFPSTPTEYTWDLSVEVALDLQSVDLLPIAEEQVAELDIGALLYQEGKDRSWEMLTGTTLRKHGKSNAARGTILYRRSFQGLGPGRYRVVAFARNRQLDLYGGASATIDLPRPWRAGVSGPVASTEDARVFMTPLPLIGDQAGGDATAVEPSTGLVPLAGGSVDRGQQMDIVTWLCTAKAQPETEALLRFLTRDDEPVFRLPPVKHEPAGRCLRIVDVIDTSALEPGAYSYRLTWEPPGEDEPISAALSFRVHQLKAEGP